MFNPFDCFLYGFAATASVCTHIVQSELHVCSVAANTFLRWLTHFDRGVQLWQPWPGVSLYCVWHTKALDGLTNRTSVGIIQISANVVCMGSCCAHSPLLWDAISQAATTTRQLFIHQVLHCLWPGTHLFS